ncbi:glycosyltransferase family 4 protein [Pseudoalteromonas sp. SWYJZ19]|uniref:glycosyltransferase family 4 protein n=1 Tax=Pseudoalteromonas sp. SWYJZ19 TaxID=2792068 RepID=UPI0018CE4E6D|nr:glycosyltransferase family 4 protein [Pseudoalteromonas sp. SWYJZ19]MBH0048913.1 glycosyltransferase family 4 protein [Pseudoalteromonas sp. SWYJZ19]
MKKFLYVINADWYFDLHWVERALYFKDEGYEIHIAMPINDPLILDRLNQLGFSIHALPLERTSMSIFNELKILIKLKKIIMLVRPDLIHSVTIKPNLYSTILCRFNKIPLISTYPGLGTLGVSKKLKYTLSRKIIFSILRAFSSNQQNIAFFENDEDLSLFCDKKVIPTSRLERVFGAGINLESFSFSPSYRENSEGLNVFFASRLLKNKGLTLLFDSVKELNEQGVKVHLKIAGIFDSDSPFAYTAEEIDKMAIYPFVDWLGKRSDIKNLISESDVVCLPTTYGEGVPRILIESCAVGRPIITTPLGGCKDICLDGLNGFLVEPNSRQSISLALKKLALNHALINEYGFNGRKLVESKFSNQSVFEQHKDKYRFMLTENEV